MSGSLDWVITSTEFNNWLNEPSATNNSLHIVGRPGSGKSTLSAFLVQHLSKSRSPVLYFFCNRNDGEKRDTIYVLRTLLAHLLKFDISQASHVLPFYQQSGRSLADSYEVVLGAFGTVMRQHQDNALYIVIDAVDECIDAWEDDGLLAQLQSSTENTKAKFIITRRDVVGRTLSSEPWSASHELTMKPEFTSKCVHKYVKQRAQRIAPIANTDLENQVVRQVSESSDGLWLYARLMMDEVERAPSEERVKRRLASLPHGLSDLYTQVLQSCEARMTDDHREFAKYLFIWLDVNDYMPEFLSDKFDRLPYNMLQLIFRFVNGGRDVFNAAALARELGTPLIEVHQIDSTYELDFVHRSAYQYLIKCSQSLRDELLGLSSKLPELPLIIKPLRFKQLYRGVTAIWYFTECSNSAQQLAGLRDPSNLGEFFGSNCIGSYFEMAYGLWNAFKNTHLPEDLSQGERIEADFLCSQLTDFLKSGKVLRWFEMSTIINYSGNYTQLLDNVIEALAVSQSTRGFSSAAFRSFRDQSQSFFLQWAYVLQQTTPWRSIWQHRMLIHQPSKFDMDSTAKTMMLMAKQWADQFFPEGCSNVGEDKFLIKSEGIVCKYCSKVVDGYKLDKHLHFACKSFKEVDRKPKRKQFWGRFGRRGCEI